MDDFDLEDLGDLDSDLDFDDLEDDRNPNLKGVAKELSQEAGKGFLEGLVKKAAKDSLPDEYDSHYYEAMEYADFSKELVGKSKSKIEKSIYGLGKEVKKLLPFQSKMLENFLERYEEENIAARQASEEAMRETAIAGELGNIFDKQLEVQKAMAAREDAKDEVRTKREMVSSKLQSDLLTSIDSNIAQQTAFTLQIGKEFYRKSLELQYKSFYVQADLLKTTKDYFKGFSTQLDNINKNTGLPDFVKLTKTEALKEHMRAQMLQSVQSRLWDKNKYIQNIKKRTESLVMSKVSDITNKVDSVTDMVGGITSVAESPQSAAMLLGNIFAGMGGGGLGEKIADKFITPKMKERLSESKAIQGGASALSAMANSPDSFFAYLREMNKRGIDDFGDEGTPMRMLRSLFHRGAGSLLDLTNPEALGGKIAKRSALTHSKPAIFDQNVHRSITETIPMYLARILQENTNLRLMYRTVNARRLKNFQEREALVYNFQDRKLSTMSEYRESITKNVLSSDRKKGRIESTARGIIGSSVGQVGKEDQALLNDKKTKAKLEGLLSNMESQGIKDFDINTLLKGGYGEAVNDIVENDPHLKKVLELVSKNASEQAKESMSSSFRDIGEVYPSRAAIEFFKAVARLAGVVEPGNITKEQGQAFTRTIFRFGMGKSFGGYGRRVTLADFVNGTILYVVGEDDVELLREPLLTLINNARRIAAREDSSLELAFTSFLGMVQTEANELANIPPETYQELYDLHPELLEGSDIGQEQLVEGKLTTGTWRPGFGKSEVKGFIRASKEEVEVARTKQTLGGFGSSTDAYIANIKARLMGAAEGKTGLSKIASLIEEGKSIAEDASKEITNKVKGTYQNVVKEAGELAAILNTKGLEHFKGSVGALADKVSSVSSNIDSAIEAEREATRVRIDALKELQSSIASGVESSTRDIENEIKQVQAISDKKIEILKNYSNEAKRLAVDIRSIQNLEGDNLTTLAKNVYDRLRKFLDDTKPVLDQAGVLEGEI